MLNFLRAPVSFGSVVPSLTPTMYNTLQDFTLHQQHIEQMTEKDFLSIPEPTPLELFGLFPLAIPFYDHIVSAVTTTPHLNSLLLTLVPHRMSEHLFWFRYFRILLAREGVLGDFERVWRRRTTQPLTVPGQVTKDLFTTYFASHAIGQRTAVFLRAVQAVVDASNGSFQKTFGDFAARLGGVATSASAVQYRVEFVTKVVGELFRGDPTLYLPYFKTLAGVLLHFMEPSDAFHALATSPPALRTLMYVRGLLGSRR